MTLDKWLIVAFGAIGCLNIVSTTLMVIGRWTKTVEHPITLEKLSWDIAKVSDEIKDLRALLDGRYTTLEEFQRKDHESIRKLLTWQTELTTERAIRAKQSQEVRDQFRSELERLKSMIGLPTRRDHTGHD
jgi:hypothetical protein